MDKAPLPPYTVEQLAPLSDIGSHASDMRAISHDGQAPSARNGCIVLPETLSQHLPLGKSAGSTLFAPSALCKSTHRVAN
jgi:hypothetical protein